MIAAAVVLGVLATWLLASVVYQFSPALRQRLRWLSVFLPLPRWTLFVQPLSNYQLLYRDRLDDGTVGAWRVVRLAVPHRWYHLWWNPRFWLSASVWEMVRRLKLLAQKEEPERLQSTAPYWAIMRFLAGLPHAPNSTARQFMITDGAGHLHPPPPRVRFVSGFRSW